jgi:hypothetical protein
VRKNAQRLKRLRRLGVRIDGDYRVTGETVQKLKLGPYDGFPKSLTPELVDVRAHLYRIPSTLQRVIIRGLA